MAIFPLRNAIQVLFVVLCVTAIATPVQGHDHAHAEADHPHDHAHDEQGWEIGLSLGVAYLDKEEESALGIHLHLLHHLEGGGLLGKLGLGAGYESIVGDEPHHAAMGSLAVQAWRALVLVLSPGVQIAKHDGAWEAQYITHIEAILPCLLGPLEIGPAFGFAHTSEERHYAAAVHIAVHP